jgi:hypothetical protein
VPDSTGSEPRPRRAAVSSHDLLREVVEGGAGPDRSARPCSRQAWRMGVMVGAPRGAGFPRPPARPHRKCRVAPRHWGTARTDRLLRCRLQPRPPCCPATGPLTSARHERQGGETGMCQRRRENASAWRSKDASGGVMRRAPRGALLLGGQLGCCGLASELGERRRCLLCRADSWGRSSRGCGRDG